ncbi:MAG: sodium/proton-translocating pyrophosphatase [Fimbriimonadaceae bacterium]|nr:MAG: sodium/proton-translocating pyrophosphatase [Fimbriimonadaceae bacterium]
MQNNLTINRWKGKGTKLFATIFTLLSLLIPTMAMASGAEANIKLEFSDSHKMFLYISLAFGLIALFFAWFFWNKVQKTSPGNEKMQEVGEAIRSGAMGYLGQQFRTMGIFVILIAVVLFFMYQGSYGPLVAALTAVCFVLGVGASYIAGYIGMKAAVNANMRVANAALTSYKSSLEIAFQSGSVAGLVTVGMGLLGATTIFLALPQDATKLLIGFGFGGSLAALFMRVGGGIFTKAADVGADLVGKVEAGIPEDDPRNPAVIADNVGDNVGDCAGMAADVFESYEVTLVAAIVLGAATAALFPTEMWMKLILFALMARGAGVIASIVGIFMVKGSDDINVDPLKSIRKGFYSSAFIAAAATLGIAMWMLGGIDKSQAIKTSELVSQTKYDRETALAILKAQKTIAAKEKIAEYAVTPEAILKDPTVKALNLPEDQAQFQIQGILSGGESAIPEVDGFEGFHQLNYNDSNIALLNYATPDPAQDPNSLEPKYITFQQAYKDKEIRVYEIEIVSTPAGPDGKPVAGAEPQKQTLQFGPIEKDNFEKQIEDSRKVNPAVQYNVKAEYPVTFYVNSANQLVAGVDADPHKLNLSTVRSGPIAVAETIENALAFDKKQQTDPTAAGTPPPRVSAKLAYVKHQTAEWWRFFVCVIFGIIMAFVFEALTDYYVGLHKRPVQELGQVSTAGPAPMIITGFAYGQESSVFSVFAIVACLLGPLMIFPPDAFGGYLLSFYGIALVGLGLLTTTGFILAMDTFGPISDNSQGVFEMSGAGEESPEGARRVQLLDAAGNTTKALTKGFAIATAVVAAVALFHAYVDEGKLSTIGMRLEIPEIFLGLLIGGAAPYLFSAFSINAVGRAAFELINEVRSQFRNDPGIMAGTSKPNYAKCVAIVTKAAQTELLGPGILAIFFPVIVGFGLSIGKPLTMVNGVEYNLVGAQALGGFLAGAILSGQLMAVLLANSGGMWDNSKKLIEDGLHGGKGTEAHKAAVVCDTVGDPFKDTAGPALNPLIKVMNLVGLLLAPAVIMKRPEGVTIGITVAAAVMLVIAIWWSKRGGMGSGMAKAEADPTPAAPSGE